MYKVEAMKKETNRGRLRRIGLTAVLCCAAVLCIRNGRIQAHAAGSAAITSESIKEKENQISQIKKEKENLKGSLSDLKEIRKGLEAQKNNLKNYVKELDGNLELIEDKIAGLKEQLTAKEAEITQTQTQLEEAQKREEDQLVAMAIHVRAAYESGDPGMLDLLLKARSFGDFLNKMDYMEKMMASDQQMWRDYKATKEYVQLCKEELELEKEVLDETREGVEAEQRNLEELIDQKNRDIISYETDISNKEKAIREYEEEIKAQEEEIRLLEAAVAEERRKLIESNRKALIYDGGTFKFPLASYTRISDDYGMRTHPTLGVKQFHNGVDFASPGGTPIYAAYDGRVVAAAYSATMGNYVMLEHGDGLYTIYMHASALYVSKGAAVARGDTIAAVGTTGRSTGNHLHFSVRLNGSYVSPWEYLKQ